MNSTLEKNELEALAGNLSTRSQGHTSSLTTFYFSIFILWTPGIIANSLALYFIVRDIRKAVVPAIILLCLLCICDLLATICSSFRHVTLRWVTKQTYGLCAVLAILHTFFRIASGVLNTLMAADRILAICLPFYYKRHVDIRTWKIGSSFAGLGIACLCLLPFIGLGDVVSKGRAGTILCSSLTYREKTNEKVYGMTFALTGFICMFAIIICNSLVIKELIKIRRRVVILNVERSETTGNSDGSDSSAKVTSFEVLFAKLMAGLAAVYLITGAPYNTITLLQQLDIKVNPYVTGYIHLLAGLTYTLDPIVYILIRKTSRKRFLDFFSGRCCNGSDLN